MAFEVGSYVWALADDHWWPCVVTEDEEPIPDDCRMVYFFGSGSGAVMHLSLLAELKFDDVEKMSDSATAAALAEFMQAVGVQPAEEETLGIPADEQRKSKEAKKAAKAARKAARLAEENQDVIDDEPAEPVVLPFEDTENHFVDEDEPVQRLREIGRNRPKPAGREQIKGITAVEVAMTATTKYLKQALGFCRGQYRDKIAEIDSASQLSKMHEADVIATADRRLSYLAVLQRSLHELKAASDDNRELGKIDELDEKLQLDMSGERCVNELMNEILCTRPSEKPERKKGPRYGYSDPLLTNDWNTKLETHLLSSRDFLPGLDLSGPVLQTQARRESKVSVMKNWMAIRDLPTISRPKDTQPVPAEGATSRRFDSIAKRSSMILASRSRAVLINLRSQVSFGDTFHEPWERPAPIQSYFQFSDLSGAAVGIQSEIDSIPSVNNYLTPVTADVDFLGKSNTDAQDEEMPEENLQGAADHQDLLPTPSQAWTIASAIPSTGSAMEAQSADERSSANLDWVKKAKSVVVSQLSKYFHGKGGKQKLITTRSEFADHGDAILRRCVKAKSVEETRSLSIQANANIEFTELDEKKVKHEVDKCMAAVTLANKPISGRQSAASKSMGDRKRSRAAEVEKF